jgi:hypothetical protein
VRLRGLGEGVGAVHARAERALLPQGQHLPQFPGEHVHPVPQPADVHAADGAVAVHQLQRRQPRDARDLAHHVHRTAALAAGQVREPERHQPAARAQQLVALAPVSAAQRVEHHVNALAAGQPADLGRVVGRAVVDGMRAALGPQDVVLGGRRGAEYLNAADGAAQLQRRDADPARRHVDEHPLAGPDRGDPVQHVVSGQVVDRQRGGLGEVLAVRDREHLPLGHAHRVRVAAKAHHGQHPRPGAVLGDALAHGVDHARRLIPQHARQRRPVRVEPLRGHHLGEAQARRPHADPHLPRPRLRIGRLPHLQPVRARRAGNPYRPHVHLLSRDAPLPAILPATAPPGSRRTARGPRHIIPLPAPSPQLLQVVGAASRDRPGERRLRA